MECRRRNSPWQIKFLRSLVLLLIPVISSWVGSRCVLISTDHAKVACSDEPVRLVWPKIKDARKSSMELGAEADDEIDSAAQWRWIYDVWNSLIRGLRWTPRFYHISSLLLLSNLKKSFVPRVKRLRLFLLAMTCTHLTLTRQKVSFISWTFKILQLVLLITF